MDTHADTTGIFMSNSQFSIKYQLFVRKYIWHLLLTPSLFPPCKVQILNPVYSANVEN